MPITWIEAQSVILKETPRPMESLLKVAEPAVYAWWDLGGELERFYPPGFPTVDYQQPLYVGMAGTNLAQRFQRRHSRRIGQSSPRLTLAALLYRELDLAIGARMQGEKTKLHTDAEKELTRWMKEHTLFTHAVVAPQDVDAIETMIIGHLLPPLNIQKAACSPYKTALQLHREAFRQIIKRGILEP